MLLHNVYNSYLIFLDRLVFVLKLGASMYNHYDQALTE